eukprot:1902816-Prymnesium_polylepis.2
MGKPTPTLYLQALRVLYYLHHHQHVDLRSGASEFEMSGMSDSDWALDDWLRVHVQSGGHLVVK